MRRIIVLALSVILALVVVAPVASGQVGQGSVASGQARELAAAWWQWALDQKSTSESPLVGSYSGGPQCDGQPVTETKGKKFFLAGTGGTGFGDVVTRTCTVPVGTQIFFPVYNILDLNVEGAQTEEELQQEVKGWVNDALANPNPPLFATVDGKPVKMERLDSPSPLFHFTLPEDNPISPLFGGLVPPGPYVGVTDGVWVALPPLSKGTHTIHFGGNGQDNTYLLTVVKK